MESRLSNVLLLDKSTLPHSQFYVAHYHILNSTSIKYDEFQNNGTMAKLIKKKMREKYFFLGPVLHYWWYYQQQLSSFDSITI
jgi:hypothetical protein